ncbi:MULTISPECIES: anti-sigma factor antagonist [unclassified Streptomyces]|uniref:anti-sigma factor antagonist n=1 Tax=unclassified Streptomyces TaxID=2593676 RepID=UPI00203527E8|nr:MULTISPECIES: anti-sigma factor antagonist [unclassified Streptomyces]
MPELASSAEPPTGGDADRANTADAPVVSPPCTLVTAVRPDGDRVVVEVSGELDLDTSERLHSVLRDALNRSVRGVDLDLTGVSFCDCSTLNVLFNLRNRALGQAKTVAVQGTSTAVDRLFGLTGTRGLFAHHGPDGQGTAARHPEDNEASEDTDASEDVDQDLRIEVAQLRRAMQTRPTIDLARGILMASFSLSSEDAWKVLVSASQHTNTKLHSLAGDLVTAVKGDALPEAVQEQLSSAVARVSASSATARAGDEDRDRAEAAD